MQVRCPYCQSSIELTAEEWDHDIQCPTCDSSFNLVADDTITFQETGRTIDRFQLLECLGTGSFGAVWKARDSELGRIVAVKIPRKERLSAEESQQFLREARAAAQLKHPNIVGMHEIGKADDLIYLISDYIEGLTLSDWLSGQQLTVREAAEICAKVAAAVGHAHQAGVIHRDLKPSNIMISLRRRAPYSGFRPGQTRNWRSYDDHRGANPGNAGLYVAGTGSG